MTVPIRRALPALLVLFVLFASQAAYAAQAQDRPNGHCAGSAPAEQGEKSCPLPLWLTCCDDQAAVGTAAGAPDAAGLLVLPAGSELASLAPAPGPPRARSAEVPPDTPLSRSVVLLI
jgi:hypothetical protein